MEELKRVSYKSALSAAKNNNMKLVMFFLFDKEHERIYHFTNCLKEICKIIDRTTGQDILFLSHYTSSASCYDDVNSPVRQAVRAELIEKDMKKINTDAYRNMKMIAKSVCTDLINDFPCFLIINPYNATYMVKQYNTFEGEDDLYSVTTQIINQLLRVNCDLDAFKSRYSEPFYIFSESQLIERDLLISTKGWRINFLKETLKHYCAYEYFDWSKIETYANGSYISVKTFFCNFNEFKIKELPADSPMEIFLDKYIMFFGRDNSFFYKQVVDYIEPTTREYLSRAFSFYKDNNYESISRYSLSVICLGKAIEDELNLGIFNAFRGAFGIHLSKNREQVQADLNDDLKVTYMDSNYKDHIVSFNKHSDSLHLEHPKIYKTHNIAFNPLWKPYEQSKQSMQNGAISQIEFVKKEFGAPDWDEIMTNLSTISNTRNDAIHKMNPISKEECEIVLDAFRYLMRVKFFEVNNALKHIENNN